MATDEESYSHVAENGRFHAVSTWNTPGVIKGQLTEAVSTPRFLGVWTVILHYVSKTFNVIPGLLICLGLRIIEYVQSQQPAKTSNMETFATIVIE